MRHEPLEVIQVDILIVGSGAAGMRAAIAASGKGLRIGLVTKGQAAHSGATPMACPSYQAAFAMEDDRDTPEVAFEDTCFEGRYLGDENLIYVLSNEATERAMDLLRYGVKFRTTTDGRYLQVAHPGHSFERNLVIMGNGFAMATQLRREMLRHPEVELFEDVVATKLLKDGERIAGLVGLDMRHGKPIAFSARAVIMATGGYQELWRWTDTEPGLTGEGVYMAYDAGADLIDLEMMLYYPTGLCYPSEVEGGRGTPHGGVYIDLTKSPKSRSEIKEILSRLDSLPYNQLTDLGIDVLREPIEVMPVTHYTLGGARINEWAETTATGLFAAGEISGNIHGANRTSGNALAETQVFGARAGTRAAEYACEAAPKSIGTSLVEEEFERIQSFVKERPRGLRPLEFKRNVKTVMHRYVHYRRNAHDLSHAITELQRLRYEELPRVQATGSPTVFNYEWQEALEAAAMVALAELVAASALAREESRGHHWRADFPLMRAAWEKHTIARRVDEHSYVVTDAPVVRLKDRTRERRPMDTSLLDLGVVDGYVGG